MPDSAPQFFLVQVSRMNTTDEADVVGTLSYVVAEADLIKPDSKLLALSAEALELQVRDIPLTDIRPMTEAEIAVYREDGADAD